MLAPEQRAKLLKRATWASVVVSIILFVSKVGVWSMTGSVAVLASLVDSLMDIATSAINLIAVRVSLAPPDQDHRFGHGKAEALSGLTQAAFIAGSALFLFLQGIDHLLHPGSTLSHLDLGLAVIAFSIVMYVGLISYQRFVVAKTGSLAIKGDSAHYVADLGTNLFVGLVLLLVKTLGSSWNYLDPICGILLSIFISREAYKIAKEAIDNLLDHELPEEERKQILQIAGAIEGVLGVHDFRTRQAGQTRFVQLHLELADELTLIEAHHVGEAVEESIFQAFPGSEVIVHLDPLCVIPFDKRNYVQEPGTSDRVLAAPMYGAHSGLNSTN